MRKKLSRMIEAEKFLQYIFFRQWSSLHAHCRSKGIQIVGDMPIYLDLERADLWSHPEIFKLDESGRPGAVADTAIIPLQDILGLGEEARMNRPATIEGNWQWRLLPEQLTPEITKRLRDLTDIYGRA